MENNNSKIVWILLGLVVVAIIIALAVKGNKKEETPVPEASATAGENLPQEEEETQTTGSTATTGSVAGSLSYTQAVEKYKDRRIQFDENCQAYPNTVTYKDNTGIMLDNRSSKARTIKLGTNYSIKAYGWRVITLPDTYRTAKTFLVDCDASQNVATILVQE
jgi:hypothetical protein